MFQNMANQPQSQTNSHLENGSCLETDLKSQPISPWEGYKTRIIQLEEDLRVLKVSISNVLHAFCALPNTNVNKELIESIEKGTISSMVLFLGRLVERLDSYRLQQLNSEKMKGLLEDTSSMNCTLIEEKEVIKNEIIDVLETSDTYEEVKNRLVAMVNRADLGTSQRQSAKRRKVTNNSLVKLTKAKRVRSSQLRSRHPMYEVGSRTRMMQTASENNISALTNRSSDGNMAADPDYVIEVSSTDGDSEDNGKESGGLDQAKVNKRTKATGTETCNSSLTRKQSPGQRKRGHYSHFDESTKLEIGRYASEHGASKAVSHFTQVLGHKVSQSTVRRMKREYSKAEYDIEMQTGEATSGEGTSKSTQTTTEPDSCDMKEEVADEGQEDTSKQVNDNDNKNIASASDSLPHWSTLVPGPGKRKRGQYNHYDEVLRAGIGRYAQAHGVTNAQRHFHEDLGVKVSESTIRSIRDQYRKLKEKGTVDPLVLPVSPRGAPSMLGYLDEKVQKWVNDTRMQGGLINTSVVVAAADNIVVRFAKHKLKRFGGDITITKHYARSLLYRMGLVKRRKSKGDLKLPNDFNVIKTNFISRLKSVVLENSVPESLIINWKQISCQLVPGGNWTSENSYTGSGLDDKRQISVILAITMSGKLLPPQIIYSGKTHRCLPKDVNFPSEWNVIYSDSQLGNEGTMLCFIDKIILPYIRSVRESLPIRATAQQAVALFDPEEANNCQTLFQKLKDNHTTIEFIPVNCKQHLQPIDLSVKEVFYDLMKRQFSEWYTKELQSGSDNTGAAIDMKTAHLKPIHAHWIIKTHKDLEKRNDLIRMGFTKAGLLDDSLSQVTSSSDADLSVGL